MIRILCIESSTNVCSVALTNNGEVHDYIEETEGMNHSRLLTRFIETLLNRNQIKAHALDAVAVSKGPGSYTGLRIGSSAAKGLCFATDIPLISICPLQSMASGLLQFPEQFQYEPNKNDLLIPMIDARRMEVYTTVFDNALQPLSAVDALIIEPGSFQYELDRHRCLFFGNGAEKGKNVIVHENAVFPNGVYTSSRYMAQEAFQKFSSNDFVDVAYFEPFYLKDFKATTPKNSILGSL